MGNNKILISGNHTNGGIRLAKILRNKGWYVELVFFEQPLHPRSWPEELAPELFKNGDPPWVHRFSLPKNLFLRMIRKEGGIKNIWF